MLTRHVRLLPILLAALLWPSDAAHAQASDSDTARAKALILQFTELAQAQELNFGDIVRSTTIAGTVTISATGTRTSTGGVTPILSTFSPGRFAGFGTRNRNVLLNVVPNQVDLTNINGTKLRVDNFNIGNLSGLTRVGTSNQYRITAANGIIGFSIGARVTVNANQDPGQYQGTYQVVFNYQ